MLSFYSKGHCGTVISGLWRECNTRIAIKTVDLSKMTKQEMDILYWIGQHEHIVNTRGYFLSERCTEALLVERITTINLVMELADSYLAPFSFKHGPDVVDACWQIADGLKFMHTSHII